MSNETKIEWADSTFNPWIGCTKVGPGCDHCYAEADFDKRRHQVAWGAGNPRNRTGAANWQQPVKWNKEKFVECQGCRWRGPFPGAARCPGCGSDYYKPARRRVFCASLADVFDNEIDPQWRADLFELIQQTPNLDWLLLTKRIGNVAGMVNEATELQRPRSEPETPFMAWLLDWRLGKAPSNIWLGVTIVNQDEADRDIRKLLGIPAVVRFLSMEPLLGPVDLTAISARSWDYGRGVKSLDTLTGEGVGRTPGQPDERTPGFGYGIDWVIAGGESGSKARPSHPDWYRSLRDQCAAAGVQFLFKQWGEWAPEQAIQDDGSPLAATWHNNAAMHGCGGGENVFRVGKKRAGRLLDGVTHNGIPEPRQ